MESSKLKLPSECNILIVDDEKIFCNMLEENLKDKYQIDTCYSAAAAFSKIKTTDYDIIVTDLKLGDGSGIDVLRLAKERDKYTEVIIITGYASLKTASEAVNLGVTSYLIKPLQLSEFNVQMEKAVASRIFHLKSLYLIEHSEYNSTSSAREHILDITSLYFITSKLMLSLDISEIMKLFLSELNEKLDAVYSLIGVKYLEFNEIHARPRFGALDEEKVIENILSVWDESFKEYKKEDFKEKQIPIYTYKGEKKSRKIDNGSFGSTMNMPLTILGKTIGFITLFRSNKEPLNKERLQFFYVFATLISSSIEHFYMDILAKRQAKTDSLTGVANHRMFHESLEREIARSNRNKQNFCLLMVDIDDFKKVNDSFGHLVGDAVLIDLTKRVSKTIRMGDILARYGGEEFVIILPETDFSGAKVLAKRILKKISKKPYTLSDKEVFCTISIGLAVYDSTTPVSKNELIGLADSALYTAKRGGKDRLETYGK